MNDDADFLESLGEPGEHEPEEMLEVKGFQKAFDNVEKLATFSLSGLDWDIVGQDDSMNGRPEHIGLTHLISTFEKVSPEGRHPWVLKIPRRFVTVMYDLLRDHVRDMCWSDLNEKAGFSQVELDADHGLMVGLYASVYAALGTTEAG